MSKLLSLVLVLALVGVVSAANNQWQGPDNTTQANWNIASNWSLGRAPMNSMGDTVLLHRSAGGGSNVIVTDAQEGGAKTRFYYGDPMILTIAGTGSLVTNGSVDQYNVQNTVTIQAGGVWNACTTGGSYKVAADTGNYVHTSTVNIYGTLNINGAAGSTLGITNDTRATNGTNDGTVNIYSTGVLDVSNYVIGTYGNGSINFIGGTGRMYVKGNVVATALADIEAGRITGVSAAQVYFNGAKTVIPEPATLALLGLGSLALLRRKR